MCCVIVLRYASGEAASVAGGETKTQGAEAVAVAERTSAPEDAVVRKKWPPQSVQDSSVFRGVVEGG